MSGILYGVGVGPGDPELLTLKGARILRECDLIAAPNSGKEKPVALEIVKAHVGDKPVLLCDLPMTRDRQVLEKSRETAADLLCKHLDDGKTVAFLTLGDPAIYSTYLYLHKLIAARGYRAEIVAGVPSFCAAAAALGESLCEAGEALHILPASYGVENALFLEGTKVLMKAGGQMDGIVKRLEELSLLDNAFLAGRVGLEGEVLLRDLREYKPGDDYLTMIVVKENAHE